jgi:SPX domain protein involved in polyphosphate accumulation
MKFGKTLLKNQIPEWSRNYINYKALKKRVNRAEEEARVGQQQACEDSVAGTQERHSMAVQLQTDPHRLIMG